VIANRADAQPKSVSFFNVGLFQKLCRPKLDVTLEEPFPLDKHIPVQHILNQEGDSTFVEPYHVKLTKHSRRSTLHAHFQFRATEDPSRSIKVVVALSDNNGKVLVKQSQYVSDQRIAARASIDSGKDTWKMFPRNSAGFDLPLALIDQIDRIELRCVEI